MLVHGCVMNIFCEIEIANLRCKGCWKGLGVKPINARNAAMSSRQVSPDRSQIVTQRRDPTHSSDNNPRLSHGMKFQIANDTTSSRVLVSPQLLLHPLQNNRCVLATHS